MSLFSFPKIGLFIRPSYVFFLNKTKPGMRKTLFIPGKYYSVLVSLNEIIVSCRESNGNTVVFIWQ